MDKFPRFTSLKTLTRKLLRDYRLWRPSPQQHSAALTDSQAACLDSYECMVSRAFLTVGDRLEDLYCDLADVLSVRADVVQAYFQPLLEETAVLRARSAAEAGNGKRKRVEDLADCIAKVIHCEVEESIGKATDNGVCTAAEEAAALQSARPVPITEGKLSFQQAQIAVSDGSVALIRYANAIDEEPFPINWELLLVNRGVGPALSDRFCCRCSSAAACRESRCVQCVSQRNDTAPYTGIGPNKKLAKVPKAAIVECRYDCPCPKEKCAYSFFVAGADRAVFRDLIVARTLKNGEAFWSVKTLSPIERNDFVLEMTGDIVQESEVCDFLAVRLYPGFCLTTAIAGSLARFLGHSCGANLNVVRVYDRGTVRVALFAGRDVKVGEELTVNFTALMNVKGKMKCDCGARECQTFIEGS